MAEKPVEGRIEVDRPGIVVNIVGDVVVKDLPIHRRDRVLGVLGVQDFENWQDFEGIKIGCEGLAMAIAVAQFSELELATHIQNFCWEISIISTT